MDKNNVLNLDEMLGKKDLKVAWKGTEYTLKTPENLNADEYMEVMNLGEKFVGYKDLKSTEELSKDILASVDRMIEIVAPELAAMKLPFAGQMLVLTFWKEQQDEPVKKKRVKPS